MVDAGRRRRGRPRRLQRPGHARPMSGAGRLDLDEVHRFANRPVRGGRDAALGRARAVRGCVDGICAAAGSRRRWTASASTPGRSTTGCSTRDGQLLGNPSTTATRAPTGSWTGRRRDAAPTSSTQRPGCSCCRSTPSTSSRRRAGTAALPRRRAPAAHPRPDHLLADRPARRRAHQRLHDRPARRPHPATGQPTTCDGSGVDLGLLAAAAASPATRIGTLLPAGARTTPARPPGAGDRGRLARHRLRRRRRARASPSASPTSPAAPGRWSGVELDAAGAHRGQPAGQLHQRAGRRRHRPLPAQRHGPVAAAGVACGRGRRPAPP